MTDTKAPPTARSNAEFPKDIQEGDALLRVGEDFTSYLERLTEQDNALQLDTHQADGNRTLPRSPPATPAKRSASEAELANVPARKLPRMGVFKTPRAPVESRTDKNKNTNAYSPPQVTEQLPTPESTPVRSKQAHVRSPDLNTKAVQPLGNKNASLASRLEKQGHRDAASFMKQMSQGWHGTKEETLQARGVIMNLVANGHTEAAISVRDAYRELQSSGRGDSRHLDRGPRGGGRQI